MKLLIIFDRDNRLYRFGEVITGKVVVEADCDSTYSEIWITYQWRTHGRGDRDKGKEERLSLTAEKTPFKTGERKEFPFHFTAPNGPVTYHGHLLNVDWYLTAQVRSGPFGHFNSEQDFLLQAGDATGAVVLGTKEIPRENLPARSAGVSPASHGLLEVKTGSRETPGLWSKVGYGLFGLFIVILIVTLIVTPLFMMARWFSETFGWSRVLAFVIAAVTLILLAALYENAYRRKLKLGEVWVKPVSLYSGSEVCCHVDFVAKRGVHLRSIKASISAHERINRRKGTSTVTETHILGKKTYTRPFDKDLPSGRRIVFDCALPVRPEAPASFSSTNNALEWVVTMKAELKRWPDWQKTFPITVIAQTMQAPVVDPAKSTVPVPHDFVVS